MARDRVYRVWAHECQQVVESMRACVYVCETEKVYKYLCPCKGQHLCLLMTPHDYVHDQACERCVCASACVHVSS